MLPLARTLLIANALILSSGCGSSDAPSDDGSSGGPDGASSGDTVGSGSAGSGATDGSGATGGSAGSGNGGSGASGGSPGAGSGGSSTGSGGNGPTAKYNATHYVSPIGSASWAECVAPATPCSALTAFASANAGDQVQFAPGDYTPPDAYGFQPANSGTAAAPIVYFGEYVAVYESDTALHARILNTSAEPGVTRNNVQMGAGAANGTPHHIVFDGLSFFQPEVAPVHGTSHMIRIHDGSTDIKVLRSYFDQDMDAGGPPNEGDNWGAIWTQGSLRVEVSDCYFQDIPGGGENNTVWTQYSSGHLVFKHSYAENFSTGIFAKGVGYFADLTPQRIHHNVFRQPRYTAFLANNIGAGNVGPFEYCDFYQNVIDETDASAWLGIYSATAPSPDWPRKVRVVNNVIYGTQQAFPGEGGIWTMGGGGINASTQNLTDSSFRNNIVFLLTPPSSHVGAWGGQQDDEGWARLAGDHNIWSQNFEGAFFGSRTLAQWQAASSREQSSTLSDDPGLVDPAARDYHLEANALARNFGEDVLNLLGNGTSAAIHAGAYVTDAPDEDIGIRPAAATEAEPLRWEYPFE